MLEPTEQFAPMAWISRPRRACATSTGVRPVKVTHSSVKVTEATTGRSVTARMACTARAISARSEKVSTMRASTPPSTSASACSRKASSASSDVTVPRGAR